MWKHDCKDGGSQAKDQTEVGRFKIVSVKCAHHQVKRVLFYLAKKLRKLFQTLTAY